jgi:hypothetical protein
MSVSILPTLELIRHQLSLGRQPLLGQQELFSHVTPNGEPIEQKTDNTGSPDVEYDPDVRSDLT